MENILFQKVIIFFIYIYIKFVKIIGLNNELLKTSNSN